MTDFDIPIKCCRCRNQHQESQRRRKPMGDDMYRLVCPRCGCEDFYDMRPQLAWCWANGWIDVGDAMPADAPDGGGAIEIARGPKHALLDVLRAAAQCVYWDKERLLVPGVREALDQQMAGDALAAWLTRQAKNRAAKRQGVTFFRML